MLTVNDLMTAVPNTVTPDTSLRHIIGIMKAGGYRQIPVLDEGILVGIITDRDIRLVVSTPLLGETSDHQTKLLDKLTVESCMTANPVSVTPDTPAYQAAEMLSMYKFGALPVVDQGTLVGIITVTDFLDHFSKNLPRNP